MKTEPSDATLVLLSDDHSGRDEMNLAGNPFALLQAASKSGQTQIRREWQRTLASGKTVTAVWEVNGHPKLGLPGPSEETIYLVLLQLTREEREKTGGWPQVVHFSRYNVIERLGWSANARDYLTLRDAFFRLQAVSIQTLYAFFDPRIGGPMPARAFNLIDSFDFGEEKPGRKGQGTLSFSWFKWSDVLHASFEAGNVRSLALDFTLTLHLPVSRRLFRLLELLRHARKPALGHVRMDIFELRDRLAMTEYKYASKIQQVLKPALAELENRGYLGEVQWLKTKHRLEATFVFASVSVGTTTASPRASDASPISSPQPDSASVGATLNTGVEAQNVEADNALNFQGEPETRQEFAQRMAVVYEQLPHARREVLMERARLGVEAMFWDRLDKAESPMALKLWQLVAQEIEELGGGVPS